MSRAIMSIPPSFVVREISRAAHIITESATHLSGDNAEHAAFMRRLVEEGVIEVLLNLLKRCADEEILHVIQDGRLMDGVGGHDIITMPSKWALILAKLVLFSSVIGGEKIDECRLTIATSIQPLMKCMVDDMKRELYKSKECWHRFVESFMSLIVGVVQTKEAMDVIFRNEGVVDMLIQVLFWPKLLWRNRDLCSGM